MRTYNDDYCKACRAFSRHLYGKGQVQVLVMEKEKLAARFITSEIVNYPRGRTSGRELTRSMKEQSCRDFKRPWNLWGILAEGDEHA